MTLAALQHLICTARDLAADREILVLGSASLLASFPTLGDGSGPLVSTYDADLCPQPFDEMTALTIHEALGEDGAFHSEFGYHADILRDSVFETLPAGWEQRLIPIPACLHASALDPHDLAAVKILVGRPKDLSLVAHLAGEGLIDSATVKSRVDSIGKSEAQIARAARSFSQVFHC